MNTRGVPFYALLGTTAVGLLTFFSSIYGTRIYSFLLSASGLTGFIAWLGIAVSHYRFRRAFKIQGKSLKELKYHAKLFPFGPLFSFAVCVLVIIGQDLKSFAKWDWQAISVSYMSIPLFLILFLYFKIKHHTKLIPLAQIDLTPHDVKETDD